ncbi:MAG TPA: hypothetical protein PLP21_14165 [Pyrinomonadaceae bacterium]|nr:hypothetical protein [Acidobacteriota bacterium]HQZ97462.1 hypothetical protein [Pyrinomonadaceae bacterium]
MFLQNSAKPYKLTLEERPGYLYAFIEGEKDTYEISRAAWQEIADKAGELMSERVLIDENITEPGSFADAYRLASEIPEMGFGRAKIAFVDRFLSQNDINQFGELVAMNRGVNGRIFEDIKAAESWLFSDKG